MSGRNSSVIVINLDDLDERLERYDDVVKFNLGQMGPNIAVLGKDRGIERPWDLILVVQQVNLERYHGLFDSILTNAVRPRLLLVVRAPDLADGNLAFTLPKVFSEQAELVRVIILTSETGCEWAPGDHKPSGLAIWPGDQDGVETISILVDTMGIPEVFNALFLQSASARFEAWTIGTKQVWFGKLPAQPLSAALYEVGDGLVGDDGKVAVLRKMPTWVLPQDLIGGASENDILLDNKKKKNEINRATERSVEFMKSVGLTNKSGLLKRISGYPVSQKSLAEVLMGDMKTLTESTQAIFEAIDATDGFGVEEHRLFDDEGIQLQRDDHQRDRYGELDSALLTSIVDGIRSGISEGHSLAPQKIKLEDIIKQVEPRTPSKILDEFEPLNLQSEISKIKDALEKMPYGPLMRVGVQVARLLRPMWARMVLASIYIWGLFTTVFEIYDKGKSRGYLPLPLAARQTVSIISIILFIVLTLGISACGYILNHTQVKITAWGKSTGVKDIGTAIKGLQKYLEDTVVNDWVLSKTRRESHSQLQYLLAGLGAVGDFLKSLLIDGPKLLLSADGIEYSPNPAVRKDFNDYAKVGVFKNMKMVTDILRMDISTIVDQKMELRVPELRGIYGEQFPKSLLEDLDSPLNEYVSSVIKRGALIQDLAQSEEASQQRRELTNTYWRNVSVIDQVIKDVVLVDDDQSIIQFVNPQNLLPLSKEIDLAVNVRFAPVPSREEVGKMTGVSKDVLKSVVFTDSVTSAGIVRLAGFRPGFVTYT